MSQKYNIQDKIQLDTEVTNLRYDGDVWNMDVALLAAGMGDLSTKERQARIAQNGAESICVRQYQIRAKVVISCVGILVEPQPWPKEISGVEDFRGQIIHSARWPDGLSLANKNVAVVGSGCSAAQVVPAILEKQWQAKFVTQIMRTPPWIEPRLEEIGGKVAYARNAPTIFTYLPFLGYMFRCLIFWVAEGIWQSAFQASGAKTRAKMQSACLAHMRQLAPAKYHDMLTPRYPYGCKRRVFDNDWLRGMHDERFRLVTRQIERLSADGLVTVPTATEGSLPAANGSSSAPRSTGKAEELVPADVIVLCNGYEATRWFHPLHVVGRDGRKTIQDVWAERGGAQAYMGTALDGFPNLFFVSGPNTAVGHTSFIMENESSIRYILKLIRPILKGAVSEVEVKREAATKWTQEVQRDMKNTVFPACRSWYQDDDNQGWNSVLYPYVLSLFRPLFLPSLSHVEEAKSLSLLCSRSQLDFMYRCMFPRRADWTFVYTAKGRQMARAKQLAWVVVLLGTVSFVYYFSYIQGYAEHLGRRMGKIRNVW